MLIYMEDERVTILLFILTYPAREDKFREPRTTQLRNYLNL